MNSVKYIIWDWNGTLVDDAWLFVELMNCLLKKRGLPLISILDYQNTFCFPLENYYKKLGFNLAAEPYEIPSMEFINLYDENKYRPLLYPYTIQLLKMVSSWGVKNYLLSAQNEESLLPLVSFYKLNGFFQLIKGTDNFHARGKEDIAGEMLNNLTAKNNEVLFIGDTNMDVRIAQRYNSNIIALAFGHQAKKRFPKKKITLVENFKHLENVLTLKLRGNQ